MIVNFAVFAYIEFPVYECFVSFVRSGQAQTHGQRQGRRSANKKEQASSSSPKKMAEPVSPGAAADDSEERQDAKPQSFAEQVFWAWRSRVAFFTKRECCEILEKVE